MLAKYDSQLQLDNQYQTLQKVESYTALYK